MLSCFASFCCSEYCALSSTILCTHAPHVIMRTMSCLQCSAVLDALNSVPGRLFTAVCLTLGHTADLEAKKGSRYTDDRGWYSSVHNLTYVYSTTV